MKVAVITPYYKESLRQLERCHQSVATQTHGCRHFMIADGHPNAALDDWDIEHIKLPHAHGDNGNTPRTIGGLSALNLGYDAFAYLDADNWYHPDHVESLLALIQRTGVSVAFSDRFVVAPDGRMLANGPEDQEENFADTSCILHTRQAARLIPVWAMMDQTISPLCDRLVVAVARLFGLRHARTGQKTMYFESNYAVHYKLAGQPVPDKVNDPDSDALVAAHSEKKSLERMGFSPKFSKQTPAS
jgi:glycosyltransferase involved in cell wall biosynthesis